MASSVDLALNGGDAEESSVDREVILSTTLMPITIVAAVIAIALIRWTVVVPCMIFFGLGWSTVTQRERIREASERLYEGSGRPPRQDVTNQASEKLLQS